MKRGRVLKGHFLYVLCVRQDGKQIPVPADEAEFSHSRARIKTEFTAYAKRMIHYGFGFKPYALVFEFPTEGGARTWLDSKTLPAKADMMLTFDSGLAKVVRL